MKKKILACFLSMVLVFTCICTCAPFSAFAFGHSDTAPLPEGIYKYWKQTDPRWNDVKIGVDPWTDSAGVYHENETIGHAGCLISSMAILARAYGLTLKDGTAIDPGTLGTALYDNGSLKYLKEGGAARYESCFDAMIPGISFYKFLQPADYVSAIRDLLSDPDDEYVIIAAVNGASHYVAVDCVVDGDVAICDTGYPRTMLSEYKLYCLLVYKVDNAYVNPGETIPGLPIWEVQEPMGIKIRDGAGLSYQRVGAYAAGTRIEVLETAEADGYLWGKTADGWCALRSLDFSSEFCICLTAPQYGVVYMTAGGTDGPAAQYKTQGETLVLSDVIPVKEGYRFLGWSEDPSAVSAYYAPGASYTEDRPLVLHAVWMAESKIFAMGIDASSYQGTVDWQAVADSGVKFVILRAGTSGGKDAMFEEYYAGAKAAGLWVGSYIYTYAVTHEEMVADARQFAGWLSGKEFEMPVYVDVETAQQAALPEGELLELVQTFRSYMTNLGYFCGVYTSYNWYDWYLGMDCLPKEYLWVAKWTLSGTMSQNLSDKFALYQYSESGSVPGIDGAVDLNVCYMDLPTIVKEFASELPTEVSPLPDSGITEVEGILSGGRAGMTVGDWELLFDGPITVLDHDGEVLDSQALMCTGYTVHHGNKTSGVAVTGDLSGDGRINTADYMLLKRHVLGTYSLTPEGWHAACIRGDKPTTADYVLLKRHVMGTYSIYGEAEE